MLNHTEKTKQNKGPKLWSARVIHWPESRASKSQSLAINQYQRQGRFLVDNRQEELLPSALTLEPAWFSPAMPNTAATLTEQANSERRPSTQDRNEVKSSDWLRTTRQKIQVATSPRFLGLKKIHSRFQVIDGETEAHIRTEIFLG